MSYIHGAIVLAGLALSIATEPAGIQRCQTGAADILGSTKAFAIQVCNLFGGTCVINHPSVASADCGTKALSIAAGQCKLYPILEWADNGNRAGAPDRLSTIGNLGCSVSYSSSGGFKYSGACAAVQCSTGTDTWGGPGFSGSGTGNRDTGVTDTSTIAAVTLVSISNDADQLKNVFLYRTGNFVGTWSKSTTTGGNDVVSVGKLPTSNGNNYGPVACPSTGNAMDSAKATGITAANLRMCGSTGKWVYFNAVNLLQDRGLYAKTSASNAGSAAANVAFHNAGTANVAGTRGNMGSVDFLKGDHKYFSSLAMDDPRIIYLLNGAASAGVLMTSDVITPEAGSRAPFDSETGGAWRSFGVAFYCDDYARTDLTTCPEANRKMFYVCDPSPNACYGTAADIGGNMALAGQSCSANSDCCSGTCTDNACVGGCGGSGGGGGDNGATATVVTTTKKAEASGATHMKVAAALVVMSSAAMTL